MSSAATSSFFDEHRFAWDGFEFSIPFDWNLSYYDFTNPATRMVRMEDDVGIRLQMEWCRPRSAVGLDRVQTRFADMGRQVESMAESQAKVEDLPAGWTGLIYTMPDRRRLAVAFWLAPGGRFFVFFRLHFDAEGNRQAGQILRRIAASFRMQEGAVYAWRCYDVELDVPADFRLVETAFQAGQKYFQFEWRFRRFFFWQFSLADHLLVRNPDLEEWAAAFLNRAKMIRGPHFFKQDGRLSQRRLPRHPLGHYDEIGHWCFRWWSRVWLVPALNAIRLAVYHHRRPHDLERLPSSLIGAPLP